mgnify:CR=1 FL=1|jgi:hypothetical protein|tara:strand:- start:87 stop:776 length:690 start_codon:yes stop_codon:yes gene_type:complete
MSIVDDFKNIKNYIDIYIPSNHSKKSFRPLTLKQQKQILDNIQASAIAIIDFFNNASNIIKENTEDSRSILVTDRPNILLSLRQNISNNYNGIFLDKVINANEKLESIEYKKEFETKEFIFNVSVPTLDRDITVNDYLLKKFKDEKQLIGKLYVNEVVKFIKQIVIKDTDKVVVFKDISVKEAFEIVESLESNNLKDIYDYISEVRDFEKSMVTIDDQQVDIGPELFVL